MRGNQRSLRAIAQAVSRGSLEFARTARLTRTRLAHKCPEIWHLYKILYSDLLRGPWDGLHSVAAAAILECGGKRGKRSATPLWLARRGSRHSQSAVAAALCRRTPKVPRVAYPADSSVIQAGHRSPSVDSYRSTVRLFKVRSVVNSVRTEVTIRIHAITVTAVGRGDI